ncbi:MAG: protein-export chaperone SecB [Gammaproteobacteria bacterium]|nr:protein-export chaperone SecB [Gammaproteobacteria bacterium]MDH5226295.1 protein-export chaperone SecB [Gammaproteobacteria bacterium]
MTDQQNAQTPNQTPAADPNAPMVTPQVVYIKDVSFESPHGPFTGGLEGQPQVNLTMRTNNSVLAPDVYEVVLQINLEARSGDKVVWLCELQQAAAFVVKNLPSTDLMQVLNLMAPNYLLTYARSTISDLVVKGGFPPFLLPLVTFEALHARQRAQQQTAEGAATVN